MGQKTRTTLKEYFESGKIPTEGNFVDLIDSFLNYIDDEIHVRTTGQKEERKKCIGLGTDTPGEKLEVAGNVKVTGHIAAEELRGKLNWSNLTDIPDLVPRGVITMWSGSMEVFDATGKGKSGDILEGWALCNGHKKNGTPDLRGRFIVGWSKSSDGPTDYEPNKTGGSEVHRLTKAELPKHHHYARDTKNDSGHSPNGATINIVKSGRHTHQFKHNNHTNRSLALGVPLGTAEYDHFWDNTKASEHTHNNGTFRGRVGNGVVDGLNDQPHENRPPYYTLAYIMKL